MTTRMSTRLSNKNIIANYKKKIKPLIINEMKRKRSKYHYESTIFGNTSDEYINCLKISHQVRQLQMKEGKISQIAIGNFYGWEDLKIGDESGLDCKKNDNSIILEIKNKYNTCNSNSQKTMLDKLSNYKIKNPNTRCIWGIVNPKKSNKSRKRKNIIKYNGVEIEKIEGIDLFKLVFNINGEDYSNEIISFIKDIINDIGLE